MKVKKILVGTDGAPAGRTAVRWAALEAQRRRRPLRVLHAFDWRWETTRYDVGAENVDVARQLSDAVVSAALADARRTAPGVAVEADAVIGDAASVLLSAAENAELLVVGSRGRVGIAGLLHGSVSRRVASRAPCPVVVVRGRGDATAGVVAVGVDDSPTADHVLAAAFDVAAHRDAGLRVVRAYLPTSVLWAGAVPALALDTPQDDEVERQRVSELLRPWRQRYPGVAAEVTVTHDSAAAALTRASHDAQLVVVGSHGHSILAAALRASTGMQLLHHTRCPVLVAHRTDGPV